MFSDTEFDAEELAYENALSLMLNQY